jgi:hypothetical protein
MNAYFVLGFVLMLGQILSCFLIVAALPHLAANKAAKPALVGVFLTMATAIWIMRVLSA